ncbi:hypothetical protein ACE1ET_07355 [Saccharicrinis sp. FJH62]|uniref:hypothetical protein n=1 Tax=Saccharicrinis sp. FJH62 TaxID=3344657 RepID=UPI0035D423E4
MIYNQKQRQLIIWDQRGTREKFVSYFLLFNLGLRLMVRDAFRRLKYAEGTVHADAMYHKEPVVNS